MKSTSPTPKPQASAQTTDMPVSTIAPQRAVQNYLNTLLQDATAKAQAEDVKALEPLVAVEPVVETVVETVIETKAVEVAKAEEPVVAEVAPVTMPQTNDQVELEQKAQIAPQEPAGREWKDGRPDWAQERFDCLLFKVAGLTLAVPLVELGGVLVIEEDLRTVFGQPNWFLGLLPSKTEGTVKAIDTARWVMPEKYPEGGCDKFKYVILVEDSDWGMACHEVADAITLEPEQVSWRSDRGRRPWLAGTVVEHMCAIMDVSALKQLLLESQAAHTKN